MGGIEIFIVLAVGTLYFTVIPWGIGTDQLVADATLFERTLKQGEVVRLCAGEVLGELTPVVGLDALHTNAHLRKMCYDMFDKLRRTVSAVFLKAL